MIGATFGDLGAGPRLFPAYGPGILEVGEVAQYVAALLEQDPLLQDVWVRGEVSNVSRPSSGHHYFSLKDGAAQMRAILFRSSAARSVVLPQNGAALVAHGRVRFYPAGGSCDLVVDILFPEGLGLAQMQLEALHRRLEGEGLFDLARKRPLPAWPRRIGVVTSPTGAVIHDLLTVLNRRYPIGEVVLAPASVQGEQAAPEMVRALADLNSWQDEDGRGVDVVVLARGGGSAEDLAAFNDERVVRAVFASRVPVVTAVGHETDTSLADLAADLRAPTPSAAAEMLVPDLQGIATQAAAWRLRLGAAATSQADLASARCTAARAALRTQARRQLEGAAGWAEQARVRLQVLSPRATLRRGYAIAERLDGRVARRAEDLAVGDSVAVRLNEGTLEGIVTAVRP